MLTIATIQMGAYISVVKLVAFLIGLFAWLPLLAWVNEDANKVHTKTHNWTMTVFLAGVIGAFVWLIIPLFIIGLLIYIIAIGTTAIIYIIHRNSMVDEFEKVLTAEHIKSLFTNEEKLIAKVSKGLVFVTE